MPLAQPALDGTYIDPKIYPTEVIDGRRVERIGREDCWCGRPGWLFVVRAPGPPKTLNLDGTNAIGGREVLWRSGRGCPACLARRDLAARFPQAEGRQYDRGVRRELVEQAADHNRAIGSAIGGMAAEVLAEILAENPGDRIAKTAMRAHPYGRQVEPIIVNLDDDASPADALFRTGPVACRRTGTFPLIPATLGGMLDCHCHGDFGAYGPLPAELSASAVIALALGQVGDHNKSAIDTGDGIVRSRFDAVATFHDWPGSPAREVAYIVDTWTFINDVHSETIVVSHTG